MKTLILALISAISVTSTAMAYEGAELFQERLDRQILANPVVKEEGIVAPEQLAMNEERAQMQRVYDLIQDEVDHIFPLFIGALDGQGAGYRFSHEELKALCAEIEKKLSYSRSCQHAAKVAAGLNKEDVYNMHVRRKKQRQIYLARMNSFDNSLQNSGVASR